MKGIKEITRLALSAILLAAIAGPVCSDTVTVPLPQLITTDLGSRWFVNNNGGTDPGGAFPPPAPPPDTVCDNSSGLTIENAFRAEDGNISAYDNAWQVFINNQIFIAQGGEVERTDNLTNQVITVKPEPLVGIDGLQVTMEYLFSNTVQAARIRAIFENTTNDPIDITVEVPVNLGSDAATTIEMTASGDKVFKVDDRWVITSDGEPPLGPVNTIVLFGPDAPPEAPTAVTETVFWCGDMGEGIGMTFFEVTIPANSTRSLMYFAGLGDIEGTGNTIAGAIKNAAMFNDPATIDASLVGDLSNTDWDETLNWRFIREGGVKVGGGGGGGGCSMQAAAGIDPFLPALLAVLSLLFIYRRSGRRQR